MPLRIPAYWGSRKGKTGDEEDHKRHGRLQETGHATGIAIKTATPSARTFLKMVRGKGW